MHSEDTTNNLTEFYLYPDCLKEDLERLKSVGWEPISINTKSIIDGYITVLMKKENENIRIN